MSDLLSSYRALPTGQRVLIGAAAVIVGLVILVNLSHILGTVLSIGLALIALGFVALVLAGLCLIAVAVVKAVGSRL